MPANRSTLGDDPRTITGLLAMIARLTWFASRRLPSGQLLSVVPLPFGRAQLQRVDDAETLDEWEYPTSAAAVAALHAFDDRTGAAPPGWTLHRRTQHWRPGAQRSTRVLEPFRALGLATD